MVWLIELTLILMTGLLTFHAARTRSTQFMLIFWISGLIMSILREFALVKISEYYTYGDFHLTILGIPLVFLLLWPNLCYVSWEWSNGYLGMEYFHAKSWDQHLPLIFVTMIFVSFFFEALLSQYQLIHWQMDTMPTLWGSTPALAPYAYGFTGVIFMKSFKILWDKPQQSWPIAAIRIAALQPLLVLVLVGSLFLVDRTIILIFAD